MNYTYIVKCSDGTFYTGWTNDLTRRMEAHNQGRGAKYTKARRPVTLIYYETFETKEEAESFLPPKWFGKDVTFSSDYHNSTLSRVGLPT